SATNLLANNPAVLAPRTRGSVDISSASVTLIPSSRDYTNPSTTDIVIHSSFDSHWLRETGTPCSARTLIRPHETLSERGEHHEGCFFRSSTDGSTRDPGDNFIGRVAVAWLTGSRKHHTSHEPVESGKDHTAHRLAAGVGR